MLHNKCCSLLLTLDVSKLWDKNCSGLVEGGSVGGSVREKERCKILTGRCVKNICYEGPPRPQVSSLGTVINNGEIIS